MLERLEKQTNTLDLTISTFHSFALSVLEGNVLESGLSFSSGIISRANQLIWGLKNIDTFGFDHIEVGNNAVEIIESIIDGISAFRDELFSPGELEPYLERKKVPLQNRYKSSSHRYVLSSSGPLPRPGRVSSAIMWTCARGRMSGSEE
jgi:superfamily I DNA/RNA helicase